MKSHYAILILFLSVYIATFHGSYLWWKNCDVCAISSFWKIALSDLILRFEIAIKENVDLKKKLNICPSWYVYQRNSQVVFWHLQNIYMYQLNEFISLKLNIILKSINKKYFICRIKIVKWVIQHIKSLSCSDFKLSFNAISMILNNECYCIYISNVWILQVSNYKNFNAFHNSYF